MRRSAACDRFWTNFPIGCLLGEIYLPIERLVAYYGRDLKGVHFPYNFALLTAKWDARSLARLIDEYEAALPSGRVAELGVWAITTDRGSQPE